MGNGRRHALPLIIALIGVLVFSALAVGSRALYNQTENRLLRQRTSEAGLALQLLINPVKLALETTAKVAAATEGSPSAFAGSIKASVNSKPQQPFSGAALFRVGDAQPIATVGDVSGLQLSHLTAAGLVKRAAATDFVVMDMVSLSPRRIGYAIADAQKTPHYVVYAERTLSITPAPRRRPEAPFAQLDSAFYLGTKELPDHLLGTSVDKLPLTGRRATQVIPFGDNSIILVMTPIGHLGSDLFANLWWIVGLVGLFVSIGFGYLTHRLLRRRDTALALAAENERLYADQRHIAETLQLSLLPDQLNAPPGVVAAARYWPAGSASLIGGDFYDLFNVDDRRWGVAIGDVCGKGIEAASLTGLARHTLRASARHRNSPAEVLRAVHQALRDHVPATFCTATFAFLSPIPDTDSFQLEISLGGHPEPLLRHADGTVETIGTRGTLLGMIEPTLTTVSGRLERGDTLVFYTDGLTDAPTDQAVPIEEVVELLRSNGDEPIEQLADSIRVLKRRRRPMGSGDDTALLIMRIGDPEPPYRSATEDGEVAVTATRERTLSSTS